MLISCAGVGIVPIMVDADAADDKNNQHLDSKYAQGTNLDMLYVASHGGSIASNPLLAMC